METQTAHARRSWATRASALALLAVVAGCSLGGGARSGRREIACMSPGECPWSGNPCVVPTCVDAQCASEPAPAGYVPEGQQQGDCKETYCDGAGKLLERAKDDDPPLDDPDPCTEAVCKGAKVAHVPLDAGAQCGGGGVCNGAGVCGVCVPKTAHCRQNIPEVCGADGAWAEAPSCHGKKPVCSDATCTGVRTIAVGGDHACATLDDGNVRCWGGDSELPVRLRSEARRVAGLAQAVEVAIGREHVCARLANGTVACWGGGEFGQLGAGKLVDHENQPVPVAKLEHVAQLAAGAFHTCARLEDGTATCWGSDASGQIGDGRAAPGGKGAAPSVVMFTSQSSPRIVPGQVAGPGSFDEIAIGPRAACALAHGAVLCWSSALADAEIGAGVVGGLEPVVGTGLGPGSHAHKAKPGVHAVPAPPKPVVATTPTPVRGLKNVVEIRAGDEHTCARLADGSVWCWGSNRWGQLGDGTKTDRKAPVRVKGLAGAVQLAAAGDHTCARLGDGSVRCWGANGFGELGDGTREARPEPTEVKGVHAATIALGAELACALGQDGDVACWGGYAGATAKPVPW